jgi:hypothetical protein
MGRMRKGSGLAWNGFDHPLAKIERHDFYL